MLPPEPSVDVKDIENHKVSVFQARLQWEASGCQTGVGEFSILSPGKEKDSQPCEDVNNLQAFGIELSGGLWNNGIDPLAGKPEPH
jgi:hypothetical protein